MATKATCNQPPCHWEPCRYCDKKFVGHIFGHVRLPGIYCSAECRKGMALLLGLDMSTP